jgi:hypothetical protein
VLGGVGKGRKKITKKHNKKKLEEFRQLGATK